MSLCNALLKGMLEPTPSKLVASAATSKERDKTAKNKTKMRSNKQKTKQVAAKRRSKAKVRFAEADKMVSITDRHKKVESEDLSQAWYQPEEYNHIKAGILSSIQAIHQVFNRDTSSSSSNAFDLTEHCLRGIETGISRELHQQRKLHIYTTTRRVLEQQCVQRLLGFSDPGALRAVSIHCSRAARESAKAVAKLDAQL